MQRKFRIATGAGLGAMVIFSAAATRWTSPPSEAERLRNDADAWVVSNAAGLPASIEQIAALPLPHRAVVMRTIPWSAREQIWRQHLDAFVLPHNELNAVQRETVARLNHKLSPSQRALVQAWRDSVLPLAFQAHLTPQKRQAIADPYCVRSKAVLGRALAFPILGMVGPRDTAYAAMLERDRRASGLHHASLLGFERSLTNMARAVLVSTGMIANRSCSCHVASMCDCPANYWCTGGGCGLIVEGCGCLNLYSCNGNNCEAET